MIRCRARHSALAFHDVSYRYPPTAEPALDAVSFEVNPARPSASSGPSGSGKSTLIQLLLRLREPTAGRYLDRRRAEDEHR